MGNYNKKNTADSIEPAVHVYFLKALRITQQYLQGVCMKLNEV
jgi:hypothetical protein